MAEQEKLPQMSDLHKAKIDITGGLDSVEFIREQRDGCSTLRRQLRQAEARIRQLEQEFTDRSVRYQHLLAERESAIANLVDEVEKHTQCKADAELLRLRAERAEAENKRLAAVVEKLPRTADGVPAVEGMELYSSDGMVGMYGITVKSEAHYIVNSGPDEGKHVVDSVDRYYSTREAAENAKESKP